MTCKDYCYHFEACKDMYDGNKEEFDDVEFVNSCTYFKDKTQIIELPCIHERYFTHICKARGLINEFSIFAKVITEDEKTVTIDRFQKFGSLHIGIITISREDFERYYKEITEAEKELQASENRNNESTL